MDLDLKKIFSNPTLGEAANGKFLDAEQAQLDENRNAEREGRKPRKVVPNPKWPGKNTNLPDSRHVDFYFEDETPKAEPKDSSYTSGPTSAKSSTTKSKS